ncbi:MAG: EAL domain-containing protein [Acidimicrobiales bacterium]|nr:EAL domain-containing protein [Acidimicrobiales bacterium]
MQAQSSQRNTAAIEHIFRVRSRVIALFALTIPFIADLGDERWWVVAAIAAVALPYNMLLERHTQRAGGVPAFVPWADQALSIGGAIFVTTLWMPVLLVMVASLATAATIFPARRVIGPAVFGVALAGVVGALTQDGVDATVGTVAFAGSAAMGTVSIWLVTRHRLHLESENHDLVQNMDAMVWELAAGDDQYRSLSPAADVTPQRHAEAERAVYGEVVENLDTAILVAHPDQSRGDDLVVAAANPAAATVFGMAGKRLVGTPVVHLLQSAEEDAAEHVAAVAKDGERVDLDRVGGIGIDRQKTYALHAFALPDDAVGLTLDDVTESTMVATALRRQALHDGLTGLPNRTLLRDRLQYALADARRRGEQVALILLDLNHFKDVNDALGHQYGDRLLTAFSRRLQNLLRECDTIARLGGDEFALLLTDATPDGASRVVKKVTEAMQEPFEIGGVTVQTTASVGVALFPDHADDADLLTQRADVAMYNAKGGGGGWTVYSPQHDRSSFERLRLLSELHSELDPATCPSLELHYQPILDLHHDEISGAEALLRWNHPEYGGLNPELIVELAELSGLIQPLAHFVANEAIATAAGWHQRGQPLRVAINLSARNLYDRHLVRWLDDTLRELGLPPDRLKCELTESQVMDDPVLAMSVISDLRDIGVQTAIDDFGTGYSSLAYLRRLAVDEIKIDKSFVTSMLDDVTELTIVRTIVDLAHNLGMSVLAEGVEDDATIEALRDFGCDRVQGYAVGRPMTTDQLESMLEPRISQTPAPERASPVPESPRYDSRA